MAESSAEKPVKPERPTKRRFVYGGPSEVLHDAEIGSMPKGVPVEMFPAHAEVLNAFRHLRYLHSWGTIRILLTSRISSTSS